MYVCMYVCDDNTSTAGSAQNFKLHNPPPELGQSKPPILIQSNVAFNPVLCS